MPGEEEQLEAQFPAPRADHEDCVGEVEWLAPPAKQDRYGALRGQDYRAATAHSRPTVDGRRGRLQEWMLALYAEVGVVARVIEAAEQLQRSEPELWAELVGRPLAGSTIRRNYWAK